MKLLLTSGGIHESFKDQFLNLLPKKPLNEISVSYITTASHGEEGDISAWVNIPRDNLLNVGISDIEDLNIKGKTKKELYEILSKKDVILVNGGNTFYLLKYIRESGFDNVIKKLTAEGKLYVGVSAGSYIMCPTIKHAYWKNPDRNHVGLKNLKGLGFIPFFVVAHFNEDIRSSTNLEVKTTNLPVVCLYDTQAVLVDNERIKVIGEGKREFFNGFKEK